MASEHASSTFFIYPTPLGRITLASDGHALTHMAFGATEFSGAYEPSALTNEASTEIQQYLAGKRRSFDVPLNPHGTAFQKRVWKELTRIPYGQTRSYQDVARALGNARAVRAVGMANKHNPLPVFIPCHRVIGANGNLVGYAFGLKIKQYLLNLEQRVLNQGSAEGMQG